MKLLPASFCAFAFAFASLGSSLPAAAGSSMPSCGMGDSVVWENTSTKVYHMQGDSFFGRTKHGSYACKSEAERAGFHGSKERMKSGSSMNSNTGSMGSAGGAQGAMTSPNTMASPMMGRHHRHKRGMSDPNAMATSSSMSAPGSMGAPGSMTAPDSMASPMMKHHHRRHKGSMETPEPSAT